MTARKNFFIQGIMWNLRYIKNCPVNEGALSIGALLGEPGWGSYTCVRKREFISGLLLLGPSGH